MRTKRAGGSTKLPFKSTIALLLLASASLVDGQTIQTLCSFNNTNGSSPYAGLTLGNDGNFYGTTTGGGSSASGTVFRVTTNGALTTLVSFNGSDGAQPYAGLTLGNDGDFYGTTYGGGSSGYGTVFKMASTGTLTTLVSFSNGNGANPLAALTLGNDGDFYGTTYGGGSSGYGTVFRVTTNGTLTTLVSFNGSDGASPSAGLTLGNDGNFYGTTTWDLGGTVFRVTTNGTLTVLVRFNNANGAQPYAGLTLGSDGNFYGTAVSGGNDNELFQWGMGTVFRVTTNGTLTVLTAFNFTNGARPFAGLTLGNDGNFYGTTYQGGTTNFAYTYGMGAVFRVTTNGTLTTVVSFNFTNGASPAAALTLGNDGNFYGTTYYGGSSNYGTVFRLLLSPVITVQPQSQTNSAGATLTFLVNATGLNPVSYQWQKNGSNLTDGSEISGSSTSSLTVTNVSQCDLGAYAVVVTNAFGAVSSSNATLSMYPYIDIPFSGAITYWGQTNTLSVGAWGTGPLYYQWFQNGVAIEDATNQDLTLTSIQATNGGLYSVVVSSALGSVTNAPAQVVVEPAGVSLGFSPTITINGVVNYSYIIQSTTNLTKTNSWVTLTNLTLTQPVQIYVDTSVNASAPFYSKYYYRVLPGQ